MKWSMNMRTINNFIETNLYEWNYDLFISFKLLFYYYKSFVE